MKHQEIRISHSGRSIHGDYFQPENGSAPVPAVVFSHGYNGAGSDFFGIAEKLAETGIASVCYTFCGGSTRDESGFPSTEMTLFTERDDCLAVWKWLEEQPGVDPSKIYLVGASMGGMVSVLAAEERPKDPAGLLLEFPAFCVPDDWNRNLPDEEKIPESLDFWNLLLGRVFFTSIRTLDVYRLMPQIACPVLLFHGDRDPVVPISYSERAAEAFPNASLHVFPGEGHGFCAESSRFVEEQLIDLIGRKN